MTETAALATLVLPAKGAFEKYGTTMNLTGDLLPNNASLQAPDFALSDLEMLSALAEQLGVPLPSMGEIESAVIADAANPPTGLYARRRPLCCGRRAHEHAAGEQDSLRRRHVAPRSLAYPHSRGGFVTCRLVGRPDQVGRCCCSSS